MAKSAEGTCAAYFNGEKTGEVPCTVSRSATRALELKKRDATAERVRLDPAEMLRLLLSALDA